MTVAELTIPNGWEEITPAWMTEAIRGRHPDAVVSDIAVVLRDDGTNRRARLELTYSAGSGPATVFAKAADPAHVELVALTSGLFHEPRLFASGVVLPLDHPAVYTAIIDEEGSDFLMIMEDVVARGADPRDSTRPMTVDQAANGVRGLAKLHSEYWAIGSAIIRHWAGSSPSSRSPAWNSLLSRLPTSAWEIPFPPRSRR